MASAGGDSPATGVASGHAAKSRDDKCATRTESSDIARRTGATLDFTPLRLSLEKACNYLKERQLMASARGVDDG
jgi:hypothetical protein